MTHEPDARTKEILNWMESIKNHYGAISDFEDTLTVKHMLARAEWLIAEQEWLSGQLNNPDHADSKAIFDNEAAFIRENVLPPLETWLTKKKKLDSYRAEQTRHWETLKDDPYRLSEEIKRLTRLSSTSSGFAQHEFSVDLANATAYQQSLNAAPSPSGRR